MMLQPKYNLSTVTATIHFQTSPSTVHLIVEYLIIR